MARQIIYQETGGDHDSVVRAVAGAASLPVAFLSGAPVNSQLRDAVDGGAVLAVSVTAEDFSSHDAAYAVARRFVESLPAPAGGRISLSLLGDTPASLPEGVTPAAARTFFEMLYDGFAAAGVVLDGVVVDGDTDLGRAAALAVGARDMDLTVTTGAAVSPQLQRALDGEGEGLAAAAADPADEPAAAPATDPVDDMDVHALAYAVAFGGRCLDDDAVRRLAAAYGPGDDVRRDVRRTVAEQALRMNPTLADIRTAAGRLEYMERLDAALAGLDAVALSLRQLDAVRERADAAAAAVDAALAAAASADDVPRDLAMELSAERAQVAAAERAVARGIQSLADTLAGGAGVDLAQEGRQNLSFSTMTFREGTFLGKIDISGMSVRDVYRNFVAPEDAGGEMSRDSVVYAGDGASDVAREEAAYGAGILPLTTMWLQQNAATAAWLRSQVMESASGQSPVDQRPVRRFFDSRSTTRLSPARALSDVLFGGNVYYTAQELDRHFSSKPRYAANRALTPEALEGFQVYSVGIGMHSEQEFWSMVPEDTDVIVDVRQVRSAKDPNFQHNTFTKVTNSFGMEYVHAKGLSGIWPFSIAEYRQDPGRYDNDPRVKSVSLSQGEGGQFSMKRVWDYGGWMDDAGFAAEMEKNVVSALREGKKVCLLGATSRAEKDVRGLLVGQWLEKNTPYRIAHIDLAPHAESARVRSQDAVVQAALGRRSALRGGGYGDVRFSSDGTFEVPQGDELVTRRAAPQDSVEERLAAGRERPWNYGAAVAFNRLPDDPSLERPAYTTRSYPSIAANAARADFTILFSASEYDRKSRAVRAAAPVHSATVKLPSRKEDYYDVARIGRAAESVKRRMTNDLAWRIVRGQDMGLDPDAVKLYVDGSTASFVGYTLLEEMTALEPAERQRILREGQLALSVDASTGVTQEDVNYFVGAVMERIVNDVKEMNLEDGSRRLFSVSEVMSSYDTGVGEAAITAAQRLGVAATVNYVEPVVTLDNETPQGREVTDEAIFQNRARGWRHELVTRQDMVRQIDEVSRQQRLADDGLTPGLSDHHMVTLWAMGMNNEAILDVMERAAEQGVVIASPSDLSEMLEACRGYGTELPDDISVERVREAWATAQRDIEEWREDGIAVVTAASPLYPSNLDAFHDYNGRRLEPVLGEDGALESRTVNAVRRRPALLWTKGDVTLLDGASVSILTDVAANGRTMGNDETRAALRRFATTMAEEGMPLVMKMDEHSDMTAAIAGVARGGRVVAVTTEGFPTGADPQMEIERLHNEETVANVLLRELRSEPSEVLSRAMRDMVDNGTVTAESFPDVDERRRPAILATFLNNQEILLRAAREFPEDDVRSSLLRLVDDNGVQQRILSDAATKAGLDVSSDVVHNGGLLVSETPPGQPATADSRTRADRIAAGLGKACAVVSQIHNARPMSIFEMAFYAAAGVTLVGVRSAQALATAFREQREVSKGHFVDPEVTKSVAAEVKEVHEDTFRSLADDARERAEDAVLADAEREGRRLRHGVIPPLVPFKDGKLYNIVRGTMEEIAGKAETIFGDGVVKMSQMEIGVLHLGAESVFIVPSDQPHVAEAVKARFGEDVHIADPFTARCLRENFDNGTITVDGVAVRVWKDTEGTAMRRPASFINKVYFHGGKVYTMKETPNGLMGLPTPAERRAAGDAWRSFLVQMEKLQRQFQHDTGVTLPGQMRYEKADHLCITPLSVEVRRGDDLRARVAFEDGRITVRNYKLQGDDYQEYHETPTIPVFGEVPRSVGKMELAALAEDIRNTLYMDRASYLAALGDIVQSREARDEMQEKIENGFLVVRDDNLDVAMNDVAWAMHERQIPDEDGMKPADIVRVFAAADRAIENDEATMRRLAKEVAACEKKLTALLEQMEAAGQDEALVQQQREVEDAMEVALSRRRETACHMEQMREVRDACLTKGAVMQLDTDAKGRDVAVNGHVITIPAYRPKAETLAAAEQKMRSMLGTGDEAPQEQAPEQAPVQDSKPQPAERQETPTAEDRLAELGRWLSEAEGNPALRSSQEYADKAAEVQRILAERDAVEKGPELPVTLKNGLTVMPRDGGQVAVDKDGNAITGVYAKIETASSRFAKAYRDLPNGETPGVFLMLDDKGAILEPDYLTNIYRVGDGVVALRREEGGYRLYDIANHARLNDQVYTGLHDFREGYAMVRNEQGKLNFIGYDGKLLSPGMWFERAGDFENGKAVVTAGREMFEIDQKGNMKPVLPAEKKQQDAGRHQGITPHGHK